MFRQKCKIYAFNFQMTYEQIIKDMRLDCDNDVILIRVEQKGGIACHTGRKSCFYQQLQDGEWVPVEPVL